MARGEPPVRQHEDRAVAAAEPRRRLARRHEGGLGQLHHRDVGRRHDDPVGAEPRQHGAGEEAGRRHLAAVEHLLAPGRAGVEGCLCHLRLPQPALGEEAHRIVRDGDDAVRVREDARRRRRHVVDVERRVQLARRQRERRHLPRAVGAPHQLLGRVERDGGERQAVRLELALLRPRHGCSRLRRRAENYAGALARPQERWRGRRGGEQTRHACAQGGSISIARVRARWPGLSQRRLHTRYSRLPVLTGKSMA